MRRKKILTNWGFSTLSSDLRSRVSSFSLRKPNLIEILLGQKSKINKTK
jgi:hypothetical protein